MQNTPPSTVTLVVAIAAAGAAAAVAAAEKPVLSLTAFAVDTAGPGRARTGTIDIVIERWSTDQERDRLRAVLMEKGSSALLSALQDVEPRAGFIRASTGLGWDIHFARQQPLPDGGRRVVIVTDRPMGFWELWQRPRSVDYEFTVAEVRLRDGKGEGRLATAARVTWNDVLRTVEIENYDQVPVRLTAVRVAGAKGK